MTLRCPFGRELAWFAAWLASGVSHGQSLSDAEQQRRQLQRLEHAQAIVAPAADVLTRAADSNADNFSLPDEYPCFINRVLDWQGIDSFPWLEAEAGRIHHRCVGAGGLRALQNHLMQRLIERGYITSRVLVPEQNLASGRLALHILAGRIGKIRSTGDPPGLTPLVLPTGEGKLLNQRDLDQALENIRRLASQSSVEFDLVPGEKPGDTDIVVKYQEGRRWRTLLTLDDSGAAATGKVHIGAILTVDSPFHLHDALVVTLNRNADVGSHAFGTRSSSLNWSMPFGYWSILAGVSQTRYKQTVAGFGSDIVYSGRGHGGEVGIGWVPYRTSSARGTLQFKLDRKVSRSFIDDTAIDVQYRNVVGYDASFAHRQYFGNAVLDLVVGSKASLPDRSSAPGLIVGAPDWNGRYRLRTFTLNFSLPFQAGQQQLRYQVSMRAQRAATLVPNFEFFSIGNRYTVRGFDGESTLASEEGEVLRNDLVWRIGGEHEIFAALDAGRVGGPHAATLPGRTLSGIACGVRGRIDRFNYELVFGHPRNRPAGFDTRSSTMSAQVGAEF